MIRLYLQQILQKEDITKSLDEEAIQAIQKETAHDDNDEPPPDNTLVDDWSDAAN